MPPKMFWRGSNASMTPSSRCSTGISCISPCAPAADSARVGDVFVSGTGNLNVWGRDHFPLMPDGAILANAGHFNDEFELDALDAQSTSSREVRPFTREYLMPDGRRIDGLGPEGVVAAVQYQGAGSKVTIDVEEATV